MENAQEHPIHPLALLSPDKTEEDQALLVADIAEQGQLVPITRWRGQVIDGRHRLYACHKLGIEPRFEDIPDDADALKQVIARHFRARHMSESQRAAYVVELCLHSTPGRPRSDDENSAEMQSLTVEQAAALAGTSDRMVRYAKKVMSPESPAIPELRQALRQGSVRAIDASEAMGEPAEVQRQALDLVTSGNARTMKRAVHKIKEENIRQPDAEKRAAAPANTIRKGVELHLAEVEGLKALVPAGTVDVIVTQPLFTASGLESCAAIGRFAAHALKETGILAVVGYGPTLLSMLERLARAGLPWVWELDLLSDGPPVTAPEWKHEVAIHRYPVFVFGKGSCRLEAMDDVIEVPARERLPQGQDRTGAALLELVERLTRPGDRVCDPAMAGRHWTALGALKANCTFIGAEAAESVLAAIQDKLNGEVELIPPGEVSDAESPSGEEA